MHFQIFTEIFLLLIISCSQYYDLLLDKGFYSSTEVNIKIEDSTYNFLKVWDKTFEGT